MCLPSLYRGDNSTNGDIFSHENWSIVSLVPNGRFVISIDHVELHIHHCEQRVHSFVWGFHLQAVFVSLQIAAKKTRQKWRKTQAVHNFQFQYIDGIRRRWKRIKRNYLSHCTQRGILGTGNMESANVEQENFAQNQQHWTKMWSNAAFKNQQHSFQLYINLLTD